MVKVKRSRADYIAAYRLRQLGLTYAAIGAELGIKADRAWQWVEKYRRMILHPRCPDVLLTTRWVRAAHKACHR